MALALREIGICEGFWGEVVEKQAQFPVLRMIWKCAADEKWGDPYLPEKASEQMDP